MIVRKTIGERCFDLINSIFMIILMFICFYPILHVLSASFSDPSRLMSHQGPLLWPLGFTLKGYKLVFENPNIISGYKNTLLYLTVGTSINILMTSMGAYVLSRKNVMFGRPMMFIITFTMYFGGGLIPWYLLMKNLGLIDNIWAMVLPGAISTYNLIVMRTSFMAIPDSLEESARIDGANDFVILFRIILPLSKAVLAVMVLFYAVGYWNSWFNAMLFLKSRRLFPLQLILREILITNSKDTMMQQMISPTEKDLYKDLIQYTTIIVGTVPIFFVYPFLQKYFTQGVMIGSLKE
jgi:putative aldouronate transport system permease protein